MTIKSLVTKAVTSSLIFASASSFAAVTQDQVVEHYADIAHAVFADSVITAKALNSSIDTFLASPSASNFEQVKQAWLESRGSLPTV